MSEDNDTPTEDFTAVVPEPQEENSPKKKSSGGLKFLTLLMLIAAVGLFVFPFVWGLEGKKMEVSPDSSVLNDWLLCLGDLHVVVLHVPIGIFVYVVMMEIFGLLSFGKFKPQLRGALFLNSITAIIAVVFGYFYFLRGDNGDAPLKFVAEGNRMGMHMWLSILFAAFVILSFISKMWAHHQQKWSPFYPLFIIIAAASMTIGAHFGGEMVHTDKDIAGDLLKLKNGEPLGVTADEVTKLPDVTDIPAGERLVYAEVVKPILYGKCWECHATAELNPLGKTKIKGELEMTSVGKLLKGGQNAEDFPTLVPGSAKESEMIVRAHLDSDDDDFMPKGKEDEPEMHFTDGEKRILAWWIDQTPLIDEATDRPVAEVPGHEAILADIQAFKPVREAVVVSEQREAKVELALPSPVNPKEVKKEEPKNDELKLALEPTKKPEPTKPEKEAVPVVTPKVGEAKKPELKKPEPKKDVETTPKKEAVQPTPVPEKKVTAKPEPAPAEESKKENIKPVPAPEKVEEVKPVPVPKKEEPKSAPATPTPKKAEEPKVEPAEPAKEAKPTPAPEKKSAPSAPRPEEKAEPKPAVKKEEVKPAPVAPAKVEPKKAVAPTPAPKKPVAPKQPAVEKAPEAPKKPVEKEEAEAPKKEDAESPKEQTPEERATEAIKKLREAANGGA